MKKKIPLQVLEIIEPFVKKEGRDFLAIESNDMLLKFIDRDENSDFYFNIESYKIESDFLLLINFKPMNKQTTANFKTWIKAEYLDSYFTNWITLLDGYENVKTIFDDPILDTFANEYYTEFEIIDEDSETIPFSSKQILFLDAYLESIELGINNFQTQENELEIKKIATEVFELRKNLTKKSKKWVVKKLSKIWAQITKQGPELIKEFLSESKKHVIKESIKYLFDKSIDIIN